MPAIRLLPRTAALAAALALAAPLPAHAQLGGLVRRAVGDRVLDRAADGADARTAAAPEYSDRVLEITAARLDQLVAGLAAERTEREREAREEGARAAARAKYEAEHDAWEREMAVFQPKYDAYTRCVMQAGLRAATTQQDPVVRRANEAIMAMPAAERDRFQARMEALSEQWEAAKAAGNAAEAARLEALLGREYAQATGIDAAELQRAMAKTRATVEGGVQACGAEPVGPVEPRDPDENDADEATADAAVRASGLTEEQYAVLRERVAAFLGADGDLAGSSYAFSAAELKVLGERRRALQAYEAQLLGEG